MAEFASKGVAGSALGLGIAGLSVALLNGGLGGLGGILGGGNTNAYVDSLNSKIAELNAEKYSDKVGIEVFKAARESDAKPTRVSRKSLAQSLICVFVKRRLPARSTWWPPRLTKGLLRTLRQLLACRTPCRASRRSLCPIVPSVLGGGM